MRVLHACWVAVLICTLLSGGVFHASIVHDHGEPSHATHSHQEESPQWATLHSSLRHEDKKDLLFLALIILGFLALAPRRFALPQLEVAVARAPRPQHMLEELRRGVAAYRRFD